MADRLKMDPQRIARLRDPDRYQQVHPERILEVVAPLGDGQIVDVGAGVGFVTLPLARRLRGTRIVACDVLPGMLELLAESARDAGLDNVHTALMRDPVTLPLDDDSASLLVMLQVHHELDDAVALLGDCRRVLVHGAPMVIVDWRAEDVPGMPSVGRRVPQSTIEQDLACAGFEEIESHDVYPFHSTVIGISR